MSNTAIETTTTPTHIVTAAPGCYVGRTAVISVHSSAAAALSAARRLGRRAVAREATTPVQLSDGSIVGVARPGQPFVAADEQGQPPINHA